MLRRMPAQTLCPTLYNHGVRPISSRQVWTMAAQEQRRTETMSVPESRKERSEVLNRVGQEEEQGIIARNGIPVTAIVPMWVVCDAATTEKRRATLRTAFAAT